MKKRIYYYDHDRKKYVNLHLEPNEASPNPEELHFMSYYGFTFAQIKEARVKIQESIAEEKENLRNIPVIDIILNNPNANPNWCLDYSSPSRLQMPPLSPELIAFRQKPVGLQKEIQRQCDEARAEIDPTELRKKRASLLWILNRIASEKRAHDRAARLQDVYSAIKKQDPATVECPKCATTGGKATILKGGVATIVGSVVAYTVDKTGYQCVCGLKWSINPHKHICTVCSKTFDCSCYTSRANPRIPCGLCKWKAKYGKP